MMINSAAWNYYRREPAQQQRQGIRILTGGVRGAETTATMWVQAGECTTGATIEGLEKLDVVIIRDSGD